MTHFLDGAAKYIQLYEVKTVFFRVDNFPFISVSWLSLCSLLLPFKRNYQILLFALRVNRNTTIFACYNPYIPHKMMIPYEASKFLLRTNWHLVYESHLHWNFYCQEFQNHFFEACFIIRSYFRFAPPLDDQPDEPQIVLNLELMIKFLRKIIWQFCSFLTGFHSFWLENLCQR